MRVYFGRIAVYIFSLLIIYLAGVYFGSFLFVLFVFFASLPLLSILFLIIWYLSIRCNQEFSTLYPVKGDEVQYRFVLANLAIFSIVRVDVHFISVSPSLDLVLSDFQTTIPARSEIKRQYEIKCPYRGIYSIGIREMVVHDLLHFFSLKRAVAPIRFSVYPRVIPIDKFSPLVSLWVKEPPPPDSCLILHFFTSSASIVMASQSGIFIGRNMPAPGNHI